LDEKQAINWLEALDKRFADTQADKIGEDDVWAAIYSEMRAALETTLPPGHVVLRQWQDAVNRAKGIEKGNRVQVPERWVSGELLGIFRTAISLLKGGHLRSLADGIRAETVAQCLDQAETLVRSGYVVAAMVLAGGGLETHLRSLCLRCGLSWQGNGSIAAYKHALDQARNQGTQSLVSSSDSSQIESWGKDRNDAAHTPATFGRSLQEVGLAIVGVRQFLLRTQ
jgi:hypothetical protein